MDQETPQHFPVRANVSVAAFTPASIIRMAIDGRTVVIHLADRRHANYHGTFTRDGATPIAFGYCGPAPSLRHWPGRACRLVTLGDLTSAIGLRVWYDLYGYNYGCVYLGRSHCLFQSPNGMVQCVDLHYGLKVACAVLCERLPSSCSQLVCSFLSDAASDIIPAERAARGIIPDACGIGRDHKQRMARLDKCSILGKRRVDIIGYFSKLEKARAKVRRLTDDLEAARRRLKSIEADEEAHERERVEIERAEKELGGL